MPKITVIIAAYNSEKYIDNCIKSILSQTYQDFEVVICDDGSTDDTWSILKEYEADNRIRILRNDKNLFAAATRNKAIKVARGKYIAIQDADDYSEPDRLEKEIHFLENNKEYDFVGSGMYQFNDKGVWSTIIKEKRPQKKSFLFGLPFAHATLLIKKEALLKIDGYRVSKETERVEDYDMIMRLYAEKFKGYNLQLPLYHYRVDQNTYRRRKYRYRIDESIVRYKGFKSLDLLPIGYFYILKPLIVGLVPSMLLDKIKYNKLN